ncbi:MAG TPA: DUF1858 domain-containing protein [Phycisphaerae bacterium]|jgi:hypothetical protein|nr:DUF1858 domain-containing protein [Phycisphaerae bacterium]HOB73031.1 DUF1858 domain-containing protein [Phycisphaerae bacterium]HOJ52920.1 DUF1858 domain-containing protein [Phycisphaerae bacterium]HOL24656.1 DUF1858 domain-containing protein [Phycisphaerae bacterium]HPP19193.1 DUF1858 domain-containing protein [Phycisphaerae bacterium]
MVAVHVPTEPVTPETMLPELFQTYPQTRAVFDRYGLSGCGGRLGPVESVRFFARSHGVDESRLLAEIRQAIENPASVQAEAETAAAESVADTVYRRFFLAGIVLILTAGATWGAWLLWKIGFAGGFTTANSIHEVNAHGHAQIFGWVGLFIMGFAYQAFPRVWHTRLAAPRLAVAAFILMLVGLVGSTAGLTLAGRWALAVPAAVAGGLLEVVAVLIFTGQILVTFRRSEARLEPYVGFAIAALFWFVAMSVMSVWHAYKTMTAATEAELLWYVATYQAPLRDLQIHGLALFMILGVCLRMLPGLFNAPQVSDRRAWWSLGILTVAVLGESILFVVYRWTGNHALAGALMIPWLMLAGGVALIALPWRLWRPFPESDRSAKFVRTAYAWLAISIVMLLLLPVYQYASGIPFSHAYYGAIRHAITVGFISLMIMGFAAKVVPTLNGIDTRQLPALWGPFALVNLGCFLRVSTQTLTDWHPAFFGIIGLSGTLEVAGLAWWGAGLVAIMLRGRRESVELVQIRAPRPARIEPTHRVADVLDWFPQTECLFVERGFAAVQNRLLRRTLARQVSVGQACRMHGVDAEQFVAALNAKAIASSSPA